MQNLDSVFFRCLIASLQSSLYHGLLFFWFVEVFGMHFSDILIKEEVNVAIGSEDSEREVLVRDSSHKV